MFVYIDALFKARYGRTSPSTDFVGGELLSADSPTGRRLPPYLLSPSRVVLATSAGDVEYTTGETTADIINSLNRIMTNLSGKSSVTYVGWYLDQIVFPSLCAHAMMCNAPLPIVLFRKLDDKWSKTGGLSLERAFMQGWYPDNRNEGSGNIEQLTLDVALHYSGMDDTATRKIKIGEDLPDDVRTTMARLSGISALHTRYAELSSWRPS